MIDFNNLTPEQKEFFTEMWESHQRESENQSESLKGFQAYIERKRKQEDAQMEATEVLKTKMV